MATERRAPTPDRAGGTSSHKDPDVVWNDALVNRPANPTNEGPATMKRGTGSFVGSDGINKPVPRTNNTRGPGQWGRS